MNQATEVIDLTGEEQTEKRVKLTEELGETDEQQEARKNKNKDLYHTASKMLNDERCGPLKLARGPQIKAMMDRLREGEDRLPEERMILFELVCACEDEEEELEESEDDEEEETA